MIDFGSFWKNSQDNGFNGRVKFDVDVTFKAGVDYNLYLNPNDKKGNDKAPDYRLNVKAK